MQKEERNRTEWEKINSHQIAPQTYSVGGLQKAGWEGVSYLLLTNSFGNLRKTKPNRAIFYSDAPSVCKQTPRSCVFAKT